MLELKILYNTLLIVDNLKSHYCMNDIPNRLCKSG